MPTAIWVSGGCTFPFEPSAATSDAWLMPANETVGENVAVLVKRALRDPIVFVAAAPLGELLAAAYSAGSRTRSASDAPAAVDALGSWRTTTV